MMRLVKNGLMFGNLYEVNSAALVERYNRALEHLIGRRMALTEFHIDISGYSPEIGHEFGDDLYLNPQGCNRMFILLSTDQKTAPLLGSQFSTSRSILRQYIDENEDQLFALTAREAVAGELLNSVFSIENPADLLNINRIDVEADTVQSHLAEAGQLRGQIETFLNTGDAWWDDVLIANMIELAKRTGDIQRNPVELKTKSFTQGNYFTGHFGGVYVFRDAAKPTIIARDNIDGLHDLPIKNILTFEDRDGIANFLRDEGLSELIVQRKNDKSAAIIKQKIDFIAISRAAELGDDLSGITRRNIRRLERKYGQDMPKEFYGLMDYWRWASMGGAVPRMGPDHPAFFYALRGSAHADRDLVNMLLSDLSRMDFRQLFICHKPLFYEAYRGWPDAKKDYVSKFLAAEYAVDKAGAREALFGPEPSMAEPMPEPMAPVKNRAKLGKDGLPRMSNPWGTPTVQDGVVVVKPFGKKRGGMREELGWDKGHYRGPNKGKNRGK
ncbi:DUF6638 family protein [Robiginitomaculum antarcticum]|uniref:DUF6638 family protein n=1 Tax=Robiginitomaculum antarcticum TaxID=437507 RepID=UPI000375FA61|nr:DUF6638 family protein [Robiginitomaculum antarcticum]